MARSAVAIAATDAITTPAAAAGKSVRKLVIVTKVKGKPKAQAPTPEQIAHNRQVLRAEAAELDARVKESFAAPIAEAIADATPEQIAQLSALKAQRDKRKAIEVQLAEAMAQEAAMAEPIKAWMRDNNKTQLRAVGIGRYCLEQRSPGVTLREASSSYTLRA